MSAAEQVHYCRVPLPEDGGWGASLVATRLAINDVLYLMDLQGVDPTAGRFTVTYDENSELSRTFVLAEWRPNK